MIYLDEYESPVGVLSLASDGNHLNGLWLDGQKYFQEKLAMRLGTSDDTRVTGTAAQEKAPVLKDAKAWLDGYFTGHDPGSLPPVEFHGTPFQEEVWDELLQIPYGKLTTYGAIAQSITERRRRKTSARAVGVAVGRNPISIMVPCHRVVGSNGSLTGYAGGLTRKVRLLELEGVDVSTLKIPSRETAL